MSTVLPDFQAMVAELLRELQPPPPLDQTSESVLSAARCLIGEYGERRVTMDEIAASAGVARVTLFRRFGSKDALVRQTYERGLRRTLERFHEDTRDAADPLVAGFVSLTTLACEDPVIQRLSRTEPEVLTDLWRAGDLPGIEFIKALLMSIAGAEQEWLVDGLARLMFSYTMIPEGRPSEGEMAAVIRRLEAMRWDGAAERLAA